MSTPRTPLRVVDAPGKLPLPELAELKRRGEKIVMVTAYDAPSGRLADAAGVELILVGDSAAMVVLGHDSTVPASMEEMLMLTRAVTRGAQRPLVVADMPFGSFQVSDELALENAIRFVKEAGADAVKLEGAGPMLPRVRAIVGAGIPVMGHIGLTPQSATDARRLQGAGTDGGEGAEARRGRARARGGRLLRDRARGGARRRRRRGHAGALDPDDRDRRRAANATARCSSGTTCSGSTRGTRRASSSATPTSAPRSGARSRPTPPRCAAAASPRSSTPTRCPRRSSRPSSRAR